MKTVRLIFIVTFSLFGLSLWAQTNKIDLSITNEPLKNFISIMESKAGYTFMLDQKIDQSQPVTVHVKQASIEMVLTRVFAGTNLSWEVVGKKIILKNKPATPAPQPTNPGRITGKIVNEAGVPMVGVTVVARETRVGVITDQDGNFSLRLAPEDRTLDFTFIGMKSHAEPIVPSKTTYNITMEELFADIDEVVVIGYGAIAKRDVTGAITSLSAKDIEQNSGGNLNIALQGKVPGMEIVSTSGEPGSGAMTSIRGASSINGGNEPLYVIDGVVIEPSNIWAPTGDATFSSLAGLNPNDIESIEVLRDAASASIYGSRAANGVVIITTKGGSDQLANKPPQINFSHTSSIVQNSRNLDVLNATEFRQIYAESRVNADLPVTNSWVINPYSPLFYRSTDWQSELFRTAYQTINNLNIYGGTNAYSYGFSLGYRDLDPTIIYTGYKQYNARVKVVFKVTEWLKAGVTVNYTKQNYLRVLNQSGNSSGLVSLILRSNPCFSPYDPETGELTDFLGGQETRNPVAVAKYAPYTFKRDWTTISPYLDVTIHKNLTLRLSGSMESDATEQFYYYPRRFSTSSRPYDLTTYEMRTADRYGSENYLTWKLNRKKVHSLTAVGGMSLYHSATKYLSYAGRDYMDSEVLPMQNASVYTTRPTESISENALLSFFTRWNYSYKGRYIAAATLRADGSSRFGPDNRWGYFPSASFGWRFSAEPFMKWAEKALYDAKLRVSAGQTGNRSIGDYDWQGVYGSYSMMYNGQPIMLYGGIPNWTLHWETTTQYNSGLDLSFYNGRINLAADAYLKRSDGLLFSFPISGYTGFYSKPSNFGLLENKGLEFLLTTTNIAPSKKGEGAFRWNTSFNLSFNRSKVLRTPNGEEFVMGSSGVSLVREGSPSGVFFAHKAQGIYSRDEDNVYTGSNPQVPDGKYHRGSPEGEVFVGGDVRWLDLNGDGVINDDDRVIVGNPNPKFIGGLGNTLSWRGFTFNLFLSWCYGNDIMNDLRRDRNSMSVNYNTGRDMLRRWREQGDVTDRPRAFYSDQMQNFRRSSMWVEDGSYLRIKDITLSYTFRPKRYIKALKVSFTGVNIFTWSNYSGYSSDVSDPSASALIRGIDSGAYPQARSYNFGVDLSF